eukprot:scaffold1184_cov132-Cylindrotheca_fusiformis.AAC.30
MRDDDSSAKLNDQLKTDLQARNTTNSSGRTIGTNQASKTPGGSVGRSSADSLGNDGGDRLLIREATAAAVQAAVKMRQSDSTLTDSDGENEIAPPAKMERRSTSGYMEDASFEASLVTPSHHRLYPSGMGHRPSKVVDLKSSFDSNGVPEAEDETSQADETETDFFDDSISRNLKSASITPKSTSNIPGDNCMLGVGEDLATILQSDSRQILPEQSECSEDAALLHAIFEGFCTPPVSIDSVERIINVERGVDSQLIDLPVGVVIEKPKAALFQLIGAPLFNLPSHVSKALFRMLLRLLTGDSDDEYNYEILVSCPWLEETETVQSKMVAEQRGRASSVASLNDLSSTLDQPFYRDDEGQIADRLYTIVRFRRNWKAPVSQVLSLVETIQQRREHTFLAAPAIRLLGLLCTAGVSVEELRRILALSTSDESSPAMQILLVRALRTAAAGASRSSLLAGKASPRSFFSFSCGPGITRNISLDKAPWPFRNDFGMALWFRAERFSSSSTLYRATDAAQNGIEISILPLEEKPSKFPLATVLAISILQNGIAVKCVKVQKCILHPRVWYHVAVRHRRSGLKGVFSLSSREQISVILDGKLMLTEALKFPTINEPLGSLLMQFGSNFDGQTGSLYVFHDNVSEATFRALYETTAGTVHKRQSVPGEWDSRRGDIVKKSRVLDLDMRRDDVDDIVLSQRGRKETSSVSLVVDLDEEDENSPLSKTAFNSRLYVVWDPRRTENGVALELHGGAHARIDAENVQPWTVQGVQDVIGSIGGVQALLPVFRSLLAGNVEREWETPQTEEDACVSEALRRAVLCSVVPDLHLLLAAFIRDHHKNAREMLRCGGIDIFEQLLHKNKKAGKGKTLFPANSLVSSTTIFPSLSRLLVKSILELHSSSSHYVGLETKIFSRVLYSMPLWFGGGSELGISLYANLLPLLSSTNSKNPEKVRDCVGVKDMLNCAKDLIEVKGDATLPRGSLLYQQEYDGSNKIRTKLSIEERRHAVDIYLGMVFQTIAAGSNSDGVSQFLHMISYYLELEWNAASQEQEMSQHSERIERSGVRQERYLFTRKACTVLLFLLQISPSVPGLYEDFAATAGSVQDGAAWILSAIVNSFCDEIRSIGVRMIVTYVERTSRNPDLPLALEKPVNTQQDRMNRALDGRASIQENTMSLISNVGHGLLSTNVGKGLAAIGPSVRSRLLSQSKLTARVVYKLLWHLLKSHRHRMGMGTQAALTSMVFIREKESRKMSIETLKEEFLVVDEKTGSRGRVLDIEWARTILEDTSIEQDTSIRNPLGISTLVRLLRFLPDQFTDQWLKNLHELSSQSQHVLQALSQCPDWQPSVFQFISELLEGMADLERLRHRDRAEDGEDREAETLLTSADQLQLSNLEQRLHLSLELYSALLGHRLREGGDQASTAIEDAASLQRVCLNGQEVFSLILSRYFANLFKFGVVHIDQSSVAPEEPGYGEPSFRLKRSARLVTDAILSNGAQGMAMPAAVGYWRCLRHLTAVTVAVVSRLGFGVADLFDYRNQVASAIDEVSGGLHGIRLLEGRVDGISTSELLEFYRISMSSALSSDGDVSAESMRERGLFRRICVTLSSQILSLLDIFIFPDSLDASLPASQLHGLALVRSTETRIGSSQGPLLMSLVRLSLLLLCHLEPCSVELLQCSSRLRCFLHWIFELAREAEALEGYSAAFNKITAPFDRLILAIVLQCHRTLGRCASLLREIESTPFEVYFDSKETQKKAYRRLLRVSLELRDILVAIFERRKEVLKASLSLEAFEELRSCLEPTPIVIKQANSAPSNQKEAVVRNLLFSTWVARFQDVETRGKVSLPEQLQSSTIKNSDQKGVSAVEDLLNESDEIILSFEKSLNACFEKYLEAQRKWAETGAVRDLECDGDAAMKRLSQRHGQDLGEIAKVASARNSAADERWKGIDRKTSELWQEWKHWKLARYTDRLGRRIVLVRNRQFDSHSLASYDLQMGIEREKEEREREERLRKKQQRVSDVMKRNVDAFKPQSLDFADEDEEKETGEVETDLQTDVESLRPEHEDEEPVETSSTSDMETSNPMQTIDSEAEENIDLSQPLQGDIADIDAWAKSFIWTDNESVVARFDSVMVVTLQYVVEGNLLLTTHGLYFHQTSDGKNVVTKDSTKISSSEEANDRRWRLSRLTEVHGRRFMLRSQALELFFSGSHELFLNFASGSKERDRFYAKLRNSCRVPMLFSPKSLNPRSIFKKSKLTELWRKRKISNFEYLMALNRMAGRTFNDIAQYPVLPWILSDYTSEKIDLSDSRVYRDLTKPVGALNPDRLSQLLERYSQLEQFGFAENEKFLYGSHYSSPGVVLHYMIRQEPFTSMAIDLQSGRFDCPDRLFFDMAESWKSCNTSSSDVKELIPEFFTLPEMFLNTNNFPLGTTQKGRPIDNVGLPPWAKGSAYEFVKIHRLALESEYVSQNLHHWVDLIFGNKQRGSEAEKAHNVFHHLSYEGSVDLDKITDDLDRQAAESHIENFGQTPSQLIVKDPHPERLSAEHCWAPLINNVS